MTVKILLGLYLRDCTVIRSYLIPVPTQSKNLRDGVVVATVLSHNIPSDYIQISMY